MVVGGEGPAPAALPPGKRPGNHCRKYVETTTVYCMVTVQLYSRPGIHYEIAHSLTDHLFIHFISFKCVYTLYCFV
jgi:hypothetical protein